MNETANNKREMKMKTNEQRKYNSIMRDAKRMAEFSGIVDKNQMALWFNGLMTESNTLDFARNVRRACATACLLAGTAFPPEMDAYTMAGLIGC